jgi:hypothetical protein
MLNWNYEDPYDAAYDIDGFMKALAKLKYPKAKSITLNKLINFDYIKHELEATNKDFLGAVNSGGEVMIAGEYYAISTESRLGEYILNALKIEAMNMYY